MSTVIIGGGDKLRAALAAFENASLNWTSPQRDNAHNILLQMAQELSDFTAAPQPPA